MATEKRLIDVNWILGEIEHDLGCYEIEKLTEDDALYVELRDVIKMVCAAPTVDAVEVVRCNDCKHGIWNEEEAIWECVYSAEFNDETGVWFGFVDYNDGNHFCSYGERK